MRKNNPKPKAFIFDFDNTLIDTQESLYKAICNTFKHFGFQSPTTDEVKSSMHKSMRDSFPEIFGEKWQEASKIYLESYKQNSNSNKIIHGAIQVLSYIKSKKIPMVILSNKSGYILREEILHLGLNDYFQMVIGSKDLPQDKPSVLSVEYIVTKLKLESTSNIWFVGDTATDIICANASGCFSVLFGNNKLFDDNNNIPSMCVENHVELLKNIQLFL